MAGQQHARTSTSRPLLSEAGSASILSAKTATGSHVLTVTDYSRAYSRAKELRLPSETAATFTVGGYSWRITYSPNGFIHGTDDWICFGLCLDPSPGRASTYLDATMVQTTYSLLDRAGQPVRSSIKKESERAMSTMKTWSYTLFMRRERFESCYVKDNGFCVRCDVTLVRRTCRLSGVMPPPDDLGRQLGDLLATRVGADVTVEMGGEESPAHRSVLAAR